MSDLRIALVAEGPTDFVIIEAALKAILPGAFILTQLQPEASLPEIAMIFVHFTLACGNPRNTFELQVAAQTRMRLRVA